MFRNKTAEDGAGTHADKLERLVDAVHASQKLLRRRFLDQMVYGRHQTRYCNAVNKTQHPQLPGRCDKSLRNGHHAGSQQGTEQYLLRPDPVGERTQPGTKQSAGKPRAGKDRPGNQGHVFGFRRHSFNINGQDGLDAHKGKLKRKCCYENPIQHGRPGYGTKCVSVGNFDHRIVRHTPGLVDPHDGQTAEQAKTGYHKISVPVSHRLRQPTSQQRPDEGAADLPCVKDTQRPASPVGRGFG